MNSQIFEWRSKIIISEHSNCLYFGENNIYVYRPGVFKQLCLLVTGDQVDFEWTADEG